MPLAAPWLAFVGSALLAAPDVISGVRLDAETAGGRARISLADPEPGPVFSADAQPAFSLELRDPRWVATLRAGPRFRFQAPNYSGQNRILTLWLASTSDRYAISERTNWLTDASVEYGQVDYANADLALGTQVSSGLAPGVLHSFGARGRTGINWQGSPRYDFGVFASVNYLKPLDDTALTGVPQSFSTAAEVNQSYKLDLRSSLLLLFSTTYSRINPAPNRPEQPDWLVTSLALGYRRELDQRTTVEAVGGATLARRLHEPPPPTTPADATADRGSTTSAFPRASLSLEHILRQVREQRVTNRAAVAMDATLDQTVGHVYPLVAGELAIQADFAEDWSVGAELTAYAMTSLKNVTANQADSSLQTAAWIGHHVAPGLDMQVGARYLTRNNRTRERGLTLLDRQTWFYLRLLYAWDFLPDTEGRDPRRGSGTLR